VSDACIIDTVLHTCASVNISFKLKLCQQKLPVCSSLKKITSYVLGCTFQLNIWLKDIPTECAMQTSKSWVFCAMELPVLVFLWSQQVHCLDMEKYLALLWTVGMWNEDLFAVVHIAMIDHYSTDRHDILWHVSRCCMHCSRNFKRQYIAKTRRF
jgi:hypothetical protein